MNPKLLSTEKLAELLDVPVDTIYRWRTYGEAPPAYRVGKHTRYALSDVLEWLEQRRADDRRVGA